MESLLKEFEERSPEIIFEWHDRESEAKGWIVINSLRGGAAGGGTRMRKGLTKNEVVSLAKVMEIKFSCSGPDIGGAKSGIDFDPEDPRKAEVLKRWYKAILPVLKNYYGTGGDLNIDEINEVIPITQELGLLHPQEGVLNGHFKPDEIEKAKKIQQLRNGVSHIVSNELYTPSVEKQYKVADLITGYGVSESVKYLYYLNKKDLHSQKVIIQGWGNVGASAAYYLAQEGALISGIIDKNGGLINTEGLGFEEVKKLFLEKRGNQLYYPEGLSFEAVNSKIWDINADILIPAAGSRLLTKNNLERLLPGGLKVISCGANVPFDDPEIFYGNTAQFADKHFSLIPDFIANCGMARTFAYLMQDNAVLTDNAIFEDVSNSIQNTLSQCFYASGSFNYLLKTGMGQALNKVNHHKCKSF